MKVVIPVIIFAALFGIWFINHWKPTASPTKAPSFHIETAITKCKSYQTFQKRVGCYENAFSTLTTNVFTKQALRTLSDYMGTDQEILTYCHDIAHAIGRSTFDNEKTLSQSFIACNETCASGCYHGAIEEFFTQNSDFESKINTMCKDIVNNTGNAYYDFQCYHGLGHGFMFTSKNDLPASLKMCDKLQTLSEQEPCYGGVFMENRVSDPGNPAIQTPHSTKYLKNDDPLYPCTIVDEKYKQTCFFTQADITMKVVNWDFKKAFAICDTVEAQYLPYCYYGVGRNIAWFTKHDLVGTKQLCDLSPAARKKYCTRGVIIDLIYTFNNDDQAMQYCKLVDADQKDDCYNQTGSNIALLTNEDIKRKAMCNVAEEGYAASCYKGAGVQQ